MSSNKKSTALSLTQLKAGTAELSVANSAMFSDASNFSLPEGAEVVSRSPMLKPADFPDNKVLTGVFKKIFGTTPQDGKKSVGVEIVPPGGQIGVALPAVATIAQGLKIDDCNKGADATSPYVGRVVSIQKLPGKLKSKRGQDAWNFLVAIHPATT